MGFYFCVICVLLVFSCSIRRKSNDEKLLSGIFRMMVFIVVILVGFLWKSWGFLWLGLREDIIKIFIIVCSLEKFFLFFIICFR